jgi:hypothetical protein
MTIKPAALTEERERALAVAQLFAALDEHITRNKILPHEWEDEFEAAAPDKPAAGADDSPTADQQQEEQ